MCAVSMVGDHYRDIFTPKPWYPNMPSWPLVPDGTPASIPGISRAEFDDLKRQVEEMKKLLVRAKDYDERNNEPHCEIEDKVALLKRVAAAVGVDLSEVFK